MSNPALLIDPQAFRENALRLDQLLQAQERFCHFDCSAFASQVPLLEELAGHGLRRLASSYLQDFEFLAPYAVDSMLLRSPMLSQVAAVVDLCDLSCNTEWPVICALSDAALVRQKIHRVIVQLDVGDLTSGLELETASQMISQLVNLRGVRLAGFKADFNGYGGILPSVSVLEDLAAFTQYIEQRYGLSLDYISALNSSCLDLLETGQIPPAVKHFVLGEALLTGRESAHGGSFAGLNQNIFSVQAEVIEAQRRPSLPQGIRGDRSSGRVMSYVDHGLIQRVNLALGYQDLDARDLEPKLRGVRYLGQTQDQSFYDVTGLNKSLRPGDRLEFMLNYNAILHALTSPYLAKVFI